jgi:NADPH:quinone reductase
VHVIATASSDQEWTLVTDLGAATTVDYIGDLTTAAKHAQPDGVDAVIHLVGDPAALAAFAAGTLGKLAITIA